MRTTLIRASSLWKRGYDAYVDATEGLMTDGSIKQSNKTGHGTSDMKIYTQADRTA
ncbi:MAG: hypothetical protein V8Q23_00800 [Eubacteriales bacterium]